MVDVNTIIGCAQSKGLTDCRRIWRMYQRSRGNSKKQVVHTGVSNKTYLIDIFHSRHPFSAFRLAIDSLIIHFFPSTCYFGGFLSFYNKTFQYFIYCLLHALAQRFCAMFQRIIGSLNYVSAILHLGIHSTFYCQVFPSSTIQKIPHNCSRSKVDCRSKNPITFFTTTIHSMDRIFMDANNWS